MASPARPTRRIRGSPTALPSLTDDLLEEIFLRLPEAADLARTSVACATFRRVITDHPFLRRFRALHPPPLLGILSDDFIPAQPPNPSAAAARAFAGAADFRCSFLPSPDRWVRCDSRGGRVLLSSAPEGSHRRSVQGSRAIVMDLAVCDPLHRRYLLVPAIPKDLVDLVDSATMLNFEPFLAPAGEDEENQGTSFRVMCLAQCVGKLVLFIFSSNAGLWNSVTFDGELVDPPAPRPVLSSRSYAHGCFVWVVHGKRKLLMLDTRRMEFSVSHLRYIDQLCDEIVIVEAEEGRLGMVTLATHTGFSMYFLMYSILQNHEEGANQWQTENMMSLGFNYSYNIMGVAGGYLLLQGIPRNFFLIPASERPNLDCFALNLRTLNREWFCGTRYPVASAQLYAGFLPSLSPPTI